MKLKGKLILLSGIPIAGLILSAIACIYSVRDITAKTKMARTESAVYADLARELELDVTQVQQFLSDISATRGQDGLGDGLTNAEKERESFLADLSKFKDMFQRENDQAQLATVESLRTSFEAYFQLGRTMAQAYIKEGPAGGNKMMTSFDAAADQLHEKLDSFVKEQMDEFRTDLLDAETTSSRLAKGTLWFGLLLIGITVTVTTISIRSITRPIHEVVTTLSTGAEQTAAAAAQISATTQGLAEGASEQAASLEETSASLEEISSMTKRNAENADNSKRLGAQARESASAGLDRLTEMGRTLGVIKSAVNEMEGAVKEMQASSQEIAKIIKTIDEIAFQTNLLALNAAVEAARAGEAGMGFSVVADEVRALAQRSAQAAKDTSAMIESAVKRSELGGVASTKVVKSLGDVEITAKQIEDVFQGIVTHVKSLDEVVAEIAAASKEQNQGIGEVNMAVGQMDKVTQSNAASAEENASAAEELSAQTEVLKGAVKQLEGLVGTAIALTRRQSIPALDGSKAHAGKPTPANWKAAAPAHRTVSPGAMAANRDSAAAAFFKPLPKGQSTPADTHQFEDF
ncbi:MAG: methyl-accepting chemotaxis protein [Verrucomicrobiota bacterium]